MEQLIVLLIVVAGSIISSYIQNKKKREEAERAKGRGAQEPGQAPSPTFSWPKSATDWQEQLRRMLEGETAPPPPPPIVPPRTTRSKTAPPIIPTKIIPTRVVLKPATPRIVPQVEQSEGDLVFASPLKQSSAAHERVAQLCNRVGARLEAADERTRAHVPAPFARSHVRPVSAVVRRLKENRQSAREAFIASLIFAPPVGLRSSAQEPFAS